MLTTTMLKKMTEEKNERPCRRFIDKIIFITGGSSGIGFATAKFFLLEGAKVIICSRSQ